MIIYNHLPVLLRLYQYKGTVLQDTVWHVVTVNLVTFMVLVFFQPADTDSSSWHGTSRPSWLPDPWFSVSEVSPIAWQMLILPLGFLLGLRSNQAYDRWSLGVDSYTNCINAGSELCRQASSYVRMDVRMDVEGGSGEGPNWQYRNAPAGTLPPAGEEDYKDPEKERLFRHVFAFLALVRQDIRKRRLDKAGSEKEQYDRAIEERLHVTDEEMKHLIECGAYTEDVNAPLIVARWLSHDVAALVERVSVPTLIVAMEHNIKDMVNAFTEIDKISDHPVPWPYTHLTQFFLVMWIYSLPLCMAPIYGTGSFFLMTGLSIILFGMDSVAREIQDPFGESSAKRPAQQTIAQLALPCHTAAAVHSFRCARFARVGRADRRSVGTDT
jgi:predicted membrane chloride channel (bestrophin family)